MPQAIDLTVKNGAATPVDKTFTLVTPAAGDGGLARWCLKEGSISAVFPELTAVARATTNESRRLSVRLRIPSSYTDAATGLTMVNSYAEMNASFSLPASYPEALKADFVAFAINLLSTNLLREMIRDAYPAT